VLLAATDAPEGVAPLYLAAHATARRDIRAGNLLTIDDIENYDSELHAAWVDGLKAA